MNYGNSKDCVVLYDAGRQQWLCFDRPVKIYTAHNLEEVLSSLREVEHQVNTNHLYAAGFIAYEAGPAFDPALVVRSSEGFPLLWFGIYHEPQVISFPFLSLQNQENIDWKPSVSEPEYHHAIQKIKDYIQSGDTYQVNHTFRLQAPFSGNAWKLFTSMIHAQGYGYGAFVNTEEWTICSASPELFFTLEEGKLCSKPMKGTVSRGRMQAEDIERADWLAHSEKNRAENLMIADMVRNDMGRIAETGSVEVQKIFDIEKYPTLWQMTSTVRCQTGAGLIEILQALFPAASITGAPKVRTMQIIAELENSPRRIYTGTIGFLSPGPRAQFNVAIRTVLIDHQARIAEYGVGGGIVWDSEKTDEWQECYTKARILFQSIPKFSLLETLLWKPEEGYFLLDDHLARLAESASYFSYPIHVKALREKLDALAKRFSSRPQRIRLQVSSEGNPFLEAQELISLPQHYRVGLARKPVNSKDVFLFHKTTYRNTYEEALRAAPGYDDVLLWNEKEELTESTIANIVVEKEGRLLTPPVECGLLPGIYRSFLLKQGKVSEAVIRVHDLDRCSKIYLLNSVRGQWEIFPQLQP